MSENETSRLHIVVTPEIKGRLEEYCARSGVGMSEIVRAMIMSFLKVKPTADDFRTYKKTGKFKGVLKRRQERRVNGASHETHHPQ